MLCALRREVKKTMDDGPYCRRNANPATTDKALDIWRQNVPEEFRGITTVELHRKDGSTLGLTVSGGTDKDAMPRVSNLRPGGLAARSDQLNVGDYIKSVNGIHLAKLRHDEIISLLKNVGECVMLEVEYELPPAAPKVSSGTIARTVNVRLHKEGRSFGFVLRGGSHEDWHKSRPLVVTYVRPGSPADREGTLAVGDRLLSVDGVPMHSANLGKALSALAQSTPDMLLQIEYDVSTAEPVMDGSDPMLVEIEKSPGSALGISLTSSTHRSKQVIVIDVIKAASVADRCGALHVGDHIVSINGTSTEHCSILEASRLLASISTSAKLEILPGKPRDTVKVQRSDQHHCWDPCVNYCHAQHPGQCKLSPWPGTNAPTIGQDISQLSINMSPVSTETSGLGSQGSNALLCPTTPSSPRNSTLARRRRAKEHRSSLSLASSTLVPGGQIVHVETNQVVLRGDPLDGFGFQLQGAVLNSEAMCVPPVIRTIDPHSPAERCGLLQVGDRLLSINGIPTEDGTLEEANRLLRNAALTNQVTLEIEFDVAESVVPSCGTFHVKLPRKRGVDVGITLSASKKPEMPLIISDIKTGSIAHRTGTLEPGDRLLAIDNVRLKNCSVEDAVHVLQQSEEMVKLKIRKDEDNTEEQDGCIIYTVELQRLGGPLGITISGTEERFDPIIISGLTKRGLAERTGALHVGDRILAINGVSLKGKPLSEAIHLLQVAGEMVTLRIKKRIDEASDEVKSELVNNLCDSENETTSLRKISKFSDIYSTLPSVDSAVESWDGSRLDVGCGGPGAGSSVALDPDEWHRNKQRNNTPSTGRCKNYPFTEEGLDSDAGLALDHKDSFWCQALEDLETCGQSELLREIEASIMSGSTLSLEVLGHKSRDSAGLPEPSLPRSRDDWDGSVASGSEETWTFGRMEEEIQEIMSPTALELHKVTVTKDPESRDFGFSVSDGYLEKGVYVNMIRPDGPADCAGLKPFDRILQVNHVRTREWDCCLTVPLIADAGDRLELVLSRNPLAQAILGQPQHGEDPSPAKHQASMVDM